MNPKILHIHEGLRVALVAEQSEVRTKAGSIEAALLSIVASTAGEVTVSVVRKEILESV